MKALQYYNEQLYVTRIGNIYGVRQVGEYMYQIMCYNTHKLINKGQLFTSKEVVYCLFSGRENQIFKLSDLIDEHDILHKK